MKKIPLSQGKVAMVDDEDYEWLAQFKWSAEKRGKTYYAKRRTQTGNIGKTIMMHRLIIRAPDGMLVDHKDGNGLNNTRDNLRLATHAQNLANRGKNMNNRSGYKGVMWRVNRSKWVAQIKVNGKPIYLGMFSTPIEAARAHDVGARKLFGEFAWLNFPD